MVERGGVGVEALRVLRDGLHHVLVGIEAVPQVVVAVDHLSENIRQICQNIAKYPSNFPKFQSKFRTVGELLRGGLDEAHLRVPALVVLSCVSGEE